jgi:uncharacterized membrane protein YcaP (DUF421 family)
MDPILSAAAAYAFLVVLLRLAGRRTLGELTPFDFVVLLLVGDLMSETLVRDDPSFVQASVLCATLVGIDIVLAVVKTRSQRVERWLDGVPVVLVQHGRPLHDVMRRARVGEEDVLAAARTHQGLERMAQIRLAVLERTGVISVIPERSGAS